MGKLLASKSGQPRGTLRGSSTHAILHLVRGGNAVPDSLESRFDVVVVGAGVAGLCAALAARQQGARVLVLEKAPPEERGGNTRFSGGLFRFAYEDREALHPLAPHLSASDWEKVEVGPYSTERYVQDVLRATEGRADRPLVEALADQSYATMQWMADLGVTWEFTNIMSAPVGGRRRLTPGAPFGSYNKGAGLSDSLFTIGERHGVAVAYGSALRGITMDRRERVVGAQVGGASGREEVGAGAVVLATGGFQANAEMRARYLGPGWDLVKVRGTRFDSGDGLRIALDLGAKAAGHWSACHAPAVDASAPEVGRVELAETTQRPSFTLGITVNRLGQRFIDEGEDLRQYTYAKMGRAVMSQPGAIAFQIFDQQTAHLLEERYSTGTPVVADTIEALAGKLGLAPERLLATVQEFNAAAGPGEFDPTVRDGKATRGIEPPKSNWALPLDSPPFLAYPVTVGITFTFGGIAIDPRARVLDTADTPIPGLYAAGEMVGGFFYYSYLSGAGLMHAAVFGKVAGAQAAREALAL